MKKISFCKQCKSVWGTDEVDANCPKCSSELVNLVFSKAYWNDLKEKEKQSYIDEWSKSTNYYEEVPTETENGTNMMQKNETELGTKIKKIAKAYFAITTIITTFIVIIGCIALSSVYSGLYNFSVLIVLVGFMIIFARYLFYLLIAGYGSVVEASERYNEKCLAEQNK